MSELRKANDDYAYFLTFPTVGWIDVFTRSDFCEIVVDSLIFCQEHKSLDIYAYVIMPSHIHLVARRVEGKMSDFIRDFKSFTAKEIIRNIQQNPQESRKDWLLHMFKFHGKFQTQNNEFMFWQKTSHPTPLDNPTILEQKIEYIHQNPVVANIVTDPIYYVYSSANPVSRLRVSVA